MNDDFLAAIAVFFIFGAPVAAWVISRVLAHQERIEMIRRGMVPPPGAVNGFGGNGYGTRMPPPPSWGPQPPPFTEADYQYGRRQMRKGLQLTFVGFALLLGLSTIGSFNGHYLGPWLLGGLVPMFIGIGQVFNAAMHGVPIPGIGNGGWSQRGAAPGQYVPPPPPPDGAPPPPPPAGPYAWRPGPTREIERDK
jgi:hypothetical protein